MELSIFTKPNRSTLILFAVLAAIVYFANVQAWGFCKECGIPKPLLYDMISPIGFWFMGVMVTFPVGILFGNVAGPFFMIIQMVYVYVLSATLVYIRKKYSFKTTDKVFMFIVGALFLITLVETGLFQILGTNETVIEPARQISLGEIVTFYIGYTLFSTIAFIFVYGTLLAGALFFALEKIRKKKPTN